MHQTRHPQRPSNNLVMKAKGLLIFIPPLVCTSAVLVLPETPRNHEFPANFTDKCPGTRWIIFETLTIALCTLGKAQGLVMTAYKTLSAFRAHLRSMAAEAPFDLAVIFSSSLTALHRHRNILRCDRGFLSPQVVRKPVRLL